MMISDNHWFRVLCFAVGLCSVPITCFAEIWMTAPQLCSGKAYSNEARAADWQLDPDQRVSHATRASRTMSTSVFPGERADFVVNVRVRLENDAVCRLILGEITFDLSNSGRETQLAVDEKTETFENTKGDSRTWTLLTVRRRDGKMTAHINGQHAIDLGNSTRAIEQIGLRATRGTIAVQNFVLTGRLERRNLTKR